jgi:hypothetical protein
VLIGTFARLKVGRLEGWKIGGDMAGAVVAEVARPVLVVRALTLRGAQIRCEPKDSAVPAVVIVFCPERGIFHSLRRSNCSGTIRSKYGSIRFFLHPRGPESGAKRGYRELFASCFFEFLF